MAVTSNYNWTLPTVSGDSGAWGTILNAAIIAVDAALWAVSAVASAALPKAGGTMTGHLKTLTSSATRYDFGNVSGGVAINLAVAQMFTLTVNGNLTLSFTNVPSGSVTSGVSLLITNPGAYTITWPTGTQWNGGAPPTFTASGKDRVVMITDDAGTTWHAVVVGQDIS
jgi:hypothetical protein